MSVVVTELDNDGICTVYLNRPDKLNALNSEVLDSLLSIINDAKTNSEIKALLLTGKGKAFCAGADIGRLKICDAELGYQFSKQGQHVFESLENLRKPSVAAVNGYAFGGGCELAISTTLRIASKRAQFGQPEVKLGVIPGYGGTQRLSRLVGKGRAMDLCLTGRFIDAETAANWGLVNEITEDDELLSSAKKTLKNIISMAPLAVASIIETIQLGFDMSLNDALQFEAAHFSKVCATQDKQEGVDAFLEKRAPAFTGS